jgi:hypothetical protein
MIAPWIITLLGLWIYPILSLILLQLTKNRPKARKIVYYVSISMTGLAIFGLLTSISTTHSIIDWIFVSSIYLTITLMLGWTLFQPRKWIEIIGIVLMFIVYGIGYLSGTIGALGVGFVIGEFETSNEIWLKNGIIYKECTLGNAIADYRGKRVEIYKTISWVPFIEWRTQEKEYYDVIPYLNKLSVEYKEKEKQIILSTTDERVIGKSEFWTDTLTLK